MKKKGLLIFCLTLGLVMASVGIAAAFTQVEEVTTEAVAVISAAPTGTMTVDILDLLGVSGPSQITWVDADITPGSTKWLCANEILYASCTYTGAGGIQIYTDNTAGDAIPKWDGIGDPKNLLKYDAPTSTSTAGLPMCWRVPFALLADGERDIYEKEDPLPPNEWHLTSDLASTYWCWMRMTDRGVGGFEEASTLQNVWVQGSGRQEAEYTFSPFCSDYIYIGANFSDAAAASTYRTTTLRLELYSL
jgi:hypothetical protein